MKFKFFKSKLVRFTNIENRNKAFANLSDEDKRKEIAFDCFKLLYSGLISASANQVYWNEPLWEITSSSSQEFQNKLINLKETILDQNCEVCARGGMMLSQIRLGNSISSTYINRDCGDAQILKGFSDISFQYMEKEYEETFYSHPYCRRTNPKLANICLNVIENGDFDRNDITDYLKLYNIKIRI